MYVENSVSLLEENTSARAMLRILEQCSVVTACTDWSACSRDCTMTVKTLLALRYLALATLDNSVCVNFSKGTSLYFSEELQIG